MFSMYGMYRYCTVCIQYVHAHIMHFLSIIFLTDFVISKTKAKYKDFPKKVKMLLFIIANIATCAVISWNGFMAKCCDFVEQINIKQLLQKTSYFLCFQTKKMDWIFCF